MISRTEKSPPLWHWFAAGALLCLLFAVSLRLHWLQLFDAGRYESDLWEHVRLAREGALWRMYSLSGALFRLLLYAEPGGRLIPVLLALAETAAVPAAWWFMRRNFPPARPAALFLVSWLAGFSIAVYLPGAGRWYLGTFPAAIWHNPTYSLLKPLAVWALGLFCEVRRLYAKGRFPLRQWAWLAAALFLATAVKPSFIVPFMPAAAVLLLADLIRFRGRHFGRICRFAGAALPSAALLPAQAYLLYATDDFLTGGVQFSFMGVLSLYSAHPRLDLLRSLAFILVSLLFLLPAALKGGAFQAAGLNLVFALGFSFFLADAGDRFRDANFFWGAYLAVFLFTLVMAGHLCQWTAEHRPRPRGNWTAFAALLLQWGVFLLHAASGALYLYLLQTGGSFYRL